MARPNLGLGSVRLYVQVTPEMHQELRSLAYVWGTTVSELTRQALRLFLEHFQEAPSEHARTESV